jgi:hypothetical protein
VQAYLESKFLTCGAKSHHVVVVTALSARDAHDHQQRRGGRPGEGAANDDFRVVQRLPAVAKRVTLDDIRLELQGFERRTRAIGGTRGR